jgi:hypothetical protein
MICRETETAGVRPDVVDTDGVSFAGNHAEQALAVWRRADPLALRPADAAGDEALDAEVLINDAQGRVLGVGKFADPIRDELEDAIQIKHAGDAARGSVHRGQLVRGLTGPGPRPRGTEDNLKAAGAFIDREDGCGRRVEPECGQDAIAEAELVGSQACCLSVLVGQAAGSQFDLS